MKFLSSGFFDNLYLTKDEPLGRKLNTALPAKTIIKQFWEQIENEWRGNSMPKPCK